MNGEKSRSSAQRLMELERYQEAALEWRKVLASEPQDTDALSSLAYCEYESGFKAEARSLIKQALASSPDSTLARFFHTGFLRDDGEFKAALAAAKDNIRLEPEEPDLWGMLSSVHYFQCKWKESLSAANKGLQFDPHHSHCLSLRTLCLTNMGKKEALAASLEHLAIDSDSTFAHSTRGNALLLDGKIDEAFIAFREALRIDPKNTDARIGAMDALRAVFPPYRWLLAYRQFLVRTGRFYPLFIALIIAFYKMLRIIASDANNPWRKPMLIAGASIGFLVFASFVLQPLMDVLIQFHPIGKTFLTRYQKVRSMYFAGSLSIMLLLTTLFALGVKGLEVIGIAVLFGTFVLSLTSSGLEDSPQNSEHQMRTVHLLGILMSLAVAACLVYRIVTGAALPKP